MTNQNRAVLAVAVAELVTTPLGIRDTAFSTRSSNRLAVAYYNAEPAPKPMADPQPMPFNGGEFLFSPSRALDDKAFPSGGAVLVEPAAAQSPQSPGTWMWGGAFGDSWFVDPTRKLTVVLLTNTALEGMAGNITTDLRDAVYDSGL